MRAAAGRPDEATIAAVRAYVAARQRVMGCVVALQADTRTVTLSPADSAAVGAALHFMRFNYWGQAPYQSAILIGLIDPEAARRELSFGGPP